MFFYGKLSNNKSNFGLEQTDFIPAVLTEGTLSEALGEARAKTGNRAFALNLSRKVVLSL